MMLRASPSRLYWAIVSSFSGIALSVAILGAWVLFDRERVSTDHAVVMGPPRETFANDDARDFLAGVLPITLIVAVAGLWGFHHLWRRLAELESNEGERRRLLTDVSHELATPLTSIRGYAEMLLNGSIPMSSPERVRCFEHIHKASQRMELLIADLLDFARLEAGATRFAFERIDWAALCHNTVERFAPRFAAAGSTLEWGGAPPEAWIDADGRRMEQVIDNLLVNAIQHVPPGHHVTVSILPGRRAAERMVRLRVEDDGPGFAEQDLPHVFDRFYRGRNAAPATGSGLGLAIVQEIVRRHGGRVRATNHDPSGAVIDVSMPAAPPPAR